ncbi:hypothetical protein [Xenorhabdus sp. SGI246]|uniref:hypothetical protein n=1 Tax=Xenorhabdus sp. SGI246 TaxID=3158263 RepID=UPI00349F42E3
MCLGSHNRIKLIVILFWMLFIISECYSSPVLLARMVLPRVMGGVIVKRSLPQAANNPVFLTVVNNTVNSVNKIPLPVLNKTNSLLHVGNKSLNWLGLGLGIHALHNDLLNNMEKVYTVKQEGNIYYSLSSEELITQLFEKDKREGKLSCMGYKECDFGELKEIRFRPPHYYDGYFDMVVDGGKVLSNRLYAKMIRPPIQPIVNNNGLPDWSPDIDEDIRQHLFKNKELSANELTALVNAVLMNASLQKDYDGMPFSSSNPVTSAEVQSVLKELNIQKVTLNDLLESVEVLARVDENLLTGGIGERDKEKGKDKEVEDYIDNAPPELEDIPTAKQIISPLFGVFPFLNNFDIPEKSAQCPVAEFEVFDRHIVMDSHCIMLEKIQGLLKVFSLIIWSFLGLRIILSS